MKSLNRRDFVIKSTTGMGALGLGLGLSTLSCASQAEKQAGDKKTKKDKLGIALVGLGGYASGQLAPALQETKHCYLSGIVTGTKSKEKIWQDKYGIKAENTYNYENYDEIIDNEDIDVIYVVLPNSMHAEYTIRAAKAGKHVICEKPMAISVSECQQMIDACKENKVRLAIGYRLHYDPFNLEMMRLGQKEIYGNIEQLEAGFGFHMGNLDQWRTDKEMAGGGPLMDLGIYALQGSIYTKGELPVTVKATNTTVNKAVWKEVEGSLAWEMTFPSGTKAIYETSYERSGMNYLKAQAEKGDFGLEPSYSYGGLAGFTPEGPMNFKGVNQQALQMDAYAQNVMNNTESLVPGEMGMRDMFFIEKIYESMNSGGKEVSLEGAPNIIHRV